MAFQSGHGGEIQVGGTTLHITEWQITRTARLAEVTNSGSGGHAERVKVVSDGQWQISIPWDDQNLPDVDVSLDEGDIVTIQFNLGDGGKFYSASCIVESNQVTNNNQNDIVRSQVSGFINSTPTLPLT